MLTLNAFNAISDKSLWMLAFSLPELNGQETFGESEIMHLLRLTLTASNPAVFLDPALAFLFFGEETKSRAPIGEKYVGTKRSHEHKLKISSLKAVKSKKSSPCVQINAK